MQQTFSVCSLLFIWAAILFKATVYCNVTECIDQFPHWFEDNNGKLSNKIRIKHDALSGYGIYSQSTIDTNEHIASIPVSLVISTGYAMDLLQQRIFNGKLSRKRIKMSVCQKSKDVLLSLGLLIEQKNDSSKWKAYFNCLPPNNPEYIHNLVIAYPKPELTEKFQTSKIIPIIAERMQFIQDSYANIVDNYAQIHSFLNHFALNAWIWALTMVWSRSFHVTVNGQKTKCLVPFGDFFNFNTRLKTQNSILNINNDLMFYDVQSAVVTMGSEEYLVFKASEMIAANRQIYAEYSLSVITDMYSLILDYGMCLQIKNEKNEIILNPLSGVWISVQDMIEAQNHTIYGSHIQKLDMKYKQFIGALIQSFDAQQLYVGMSHNSNSARYSLHLLSFVLSATQESLLLYGNHLLKELQNKYEMNAKRYNKVMDLVMAFDTESDGLVAQIINSSHAKLREFLQYLMMKYETTIIQDLVYLDSGIGGDHCWFNIRLAEKFVLLNLYSAKNIKIH